jgi:hypothetical protein
MAKIPFVIGRDVFPDYAFEGPNTITLYTHPDLMRWACSSLGQYVRVDRGPRAGLAYVYSVCAPRGSRPSFTIIVRWDQ